MMTAWDYNPGEDSGNKTGKMNCLMQLVRGMDWEASKLMQPTRVRLGMSDEIQELRPKVQVS